MPTRKSTSDTAADTDGPSPQPPSHSQQSNIQATEQQLKARAEGGVSIEDYLLPRSLTLRLAKSVLPPNTAIQKDAVLAIQKAATVFVSYLSSHANEATLKRTLAPADVFAALSELELDAFQPRLEKELEAFTELKAGKRKAKKGGADAEGTGAGMGAGQQAVKADGEVAVREAKRVKRGENGGVSATRTAVEEEEEDDDDDTQEEQEQGLENGEEVEEEDEESGDEGEDEDETQEEDEDVDRVEDLDRDLRPQRTMDPDAAGDETDSEDEMGSGSHLQRGLGLG